MTIQTAKILNLEAPIRHTNGAVTITVSVKCHPQAVLLAQQAGDNRPHFIMNGATAIFSADKGFQLAVQEYSRMDFPVLAKEFSDASGEYYFWQPEQLDLFMSTPHG